MTVRESLVLLAGTIVTLSVGTGVASAQCPGGTTSPMTCTNSTSLSVTFTNDTFTTPNTANVYPSVITIPNTVTGTITNLVVVLNGFNANGTGNSPPPLSLPYSGTSGTGMLLVHKDSGKNLELMASPGDGNETFTNITFYISDSAVSGVSPVNTFGYMPTSGQPCPGGESPAVPWTPPGFGGTSTNKTMDYRPSSYYQAAGPNLAYPSPAPTAVTHSGPCSIGTGTLSMFNGDSPAGTWQLYLDDDFYDLVGMTGGWSLIVTYSSSTTTTTTTLSSSANPSFTSGTNSSVTLTAGVTGTGTVTGGTVAFMDGATTISGCGAIPLSNASAQCTTSFTTEGFHDLSAAYSGAGTFGASSTVTPVYQFVENHTSGSSPTFCNSGANPAVTGSTGAINLGSADGNISGTDTQPYPSVINVTGISNNVSTVQLALKGVSTSDLIDLSMLLVSPDGNHALDFFDFVGGGVSTSSTQVTIADSPTCTAQAPNGSGGLASPACYQPTSYRSSTSVPPPGFSTTQSPAPQTPVNFSVAAPGGGTSSKTLLEAFNGATSNGNWTLYVYDHGDVNTSSIADGWCLTITPGTGLSTTTTVSGIPNGAAPSGAANGTMVTVTATVKAGTTPVTTGSVIFTENGAPVAGGPAGAVNVGSNGQASFTTSSLPQGDHDILATFTDSSNTYSESFGSYVQRVDNTTTMTVTGTEVSYCNAGPIAVPGVNNATDLGAGFPNPSNINVSNLFGTINKVTVSLNGYTEGQPDLVTSLLVGPAANVGATFDFFSKLGGATDLTTPISMTISDAGTSPTGTLTNGSDYKPTSNVTSADTYTASLSGFYTLPASFNYAATFGASTFASVYTTNNPDPNGNWDLYLYQAGDNPGGGFSSGWCLNFTQNPPALTLHKGHTGNFSQGGTGQFQLTVMNNSGPGSAGGAIAVSVSDTMPTGLTPTSGSGTDWNCLAPVGQTITCTNADVVASGGSYPVLTLNVNVASNAPTSVSNTASVNGSGNTTAVNSNTDTVTIVPPPTLSISKSPSGTFTQGQTAIWDVIVSNTAAPGSVTSGTVTMVDTLPTGYSLASNTGAPTWTCGAVTITVTCTSTAAVASGASYPTIGLTVNVPATSPTSVTNNAGVYGGGDPVHFSSGTEATAFSTVTVIQVPANIALTAGNNQSVAVTNAFPTNLSVTVTDANSAPINLATVTFTAPASGASGTFAGGTNSKTATTNTSGVATATVYTANSTAGGPYNISVAAGAITKNFSETNLPGPATQMTANAGSTPQTTGVSTPFGNPLAVTVKDASNNPVSGVSVIFTAPSTGASGTFSNSTGTITVMTNSSGVASAPFTANATAGGPYTVTAAATGLTTVNFSLTNSGTGPVITLNPTNVSVAAGSMATFTAAATGNPTPTVQWQVSINGGVSFNNISGAISPTLAFTASGSMNGYLYQAVFTNTAGSTPTTAATLTVSKLTPVITWSNPADILFGGALGSAQLNATANVAGTFVYTPPAGTVLPLGSGQTLSVTFTPTDTADYNNASKSVTINVDPNSGGGSPANPIVTYVLTRDLSTQDVIATITVANSGGTDATNVQITGATIGGISTLANLPIVLGTVSAGGQSTITALFPSTVGATGSRAVLSIAGTYTGGTFGSNGRVVLP
jgi:hypothetical protein